MGPGVEPDPGPASTFRSLPGPGFECVVRRLDGETRRRLELELHVVGALDLNDRVARDPHVRRRDREIRILEQRHRNGVLQRDADERLLRHADDLGRARRDLRRAIAGRDARHDGQLRRRDLAWAALRADGSAPFRLARPCAAPAAPRAARPSAPTIGWKAAKLHGVTMPNARGLASQRLTLTPLLERIVPSTRCSSTTDSLSCVCARSSLPRACASST
jgi:hypothetical protein